MPGLAEGRKCLFWQVQRELQEVKERAAAITASAGGDLDEYDKIKEVAPCAAPRSDLSAMHEGALRS